MKEKELRAHATCSMCKDKIGKSGMPLFYRVTIERFGVKLDAVRRQTGVEMMLDGHVDLAMAMGPGEDMAVPLMEKLVLVVCEACSTTMHPCCVARMAELESTVEQPR